MGNKYPNKHLAFGSVFIRVFISHKPSSSGFILYILPARKKFIARENRDFQFARACTCVYARGLIASKEIH